MAEKKVIDLVVNDNLNETESNLQSLSGQINSSTSDVKKLNNSFEELNNTTHDVNASFEDVYGELQPLTARMGEAEDRLYELSLAGQQGSAEFQQLLETVGNYRRVQIQTDLAVDSAATTMSQKLGGSLEFVSGGFAVAQGALGAFGVESETLEKSILKVQSALAITQGISAMRESYNSVKQLGMAIKGLTIFQTAYNFVNAATSQGLKILRIALISTGIGALVIAVGLLIANFDKVKKFILNLFPGLGKLSGYVGGLVEDFTDFIGVTDEASRKLEEVKKAADRTLANNKRFLQEHGDQIDEYTKQKIEAKNAYAEALKEDGANQIALAKRLNRELARIDAARAKEAADKAKEEQDKKDAKAKELYEKAKSKREEAKREAEAYNKSILDAERRYTDEVLDLEADTERKKLELWNTRQQEEIKALAKNEKDKLRLLTALKADYNKKLNDIQKKENDENFKILNENLEKQIQAEFDAYDKKLKKRTDTDLEDAKNAELSFAQRIAAIKDREAQLNNIYFDSEDAKLEYTKQNAEQLIAIQKEQAQKEQEIRDAKLQAQLSFADAARGAVNALGALFEQGTAAAKTAALADIAIGTATGFIQALDIAQKSSKATGPAAAFAFPIFYASQIASVLGAASRAKSVLESGNASSGGGVSGGAAPSINAPRFNVVGTGGANQIAQSISQQSNQPIKAYVVSKDVTTAQSLDRNIVSAASM